MTSQTVTIPHDKETERRATTLVVTRHKSFLEYLREKGITNNNVEVKAHVTIEDVKDRHVIGVLPPHLALHARYVTAIPLDLTLEQRERERNTGEDLTLSEIRAAAGPAFSYVVEKRLNPGRL